MIRLPVQLLLLVATGVALECDQGRRLPDDRIDDNFCDCADRTDEPHTIACADEPRAALIDEPLLAGRLVQSMEAAQAGDCIDGSRVQSFTHRAGAKTSSVYCLPVIVNIGVPKGGTGELRTWIGKHPGVIAHAGEVHYFDRTKQRRENVTTCDSPRERDQIRTGYASKFEMPKTAMGKRVYFEKTPAYFDAVDPSLFACAVPHVRLLLMLREPASRALSDYQMCWRRDCDPDVDALFSRLLVGEDPPQLDSREASHVDPKILRILSVGRYAEHLERWLRVAVLDTHANAPRVLWLEHFKAAPFLCMRVIETHFGLAHYDYRAHAERNEVGLWVVGKSKSTSETGPKLAPSNATKARLVAYYALWQEKLKVMLDQFSLSLLPQLPLPS